MENQNQNQGNQRQQGNQGGESYTSAQNAPQGTGSYGSGYGQADQSQSEQTQSGQTHSQMASGDNTSQGGNQQQMGYAGGGTGQYARDSDEDMDAEHNPSAEKSDDEDSDMDDTTGSDYRDSDSTSDR